MRTFLTLLILFSTPLLRGAESVDVAIVGGGLAGTYCAWRLKEEGGKTVALYEMSDRIGGRLYSIHLPGMPHEIAELGGMRFLKTHAMVYNLGELLSLKIAPFPTDEPNNLLFLRNKHLRNIDFKDPTKVPYNLTFQEQGKSPNELLLFAFQLILPNFHSFTEKGLHQLVRSWHVEGKSLYDIGYWDLLQRVLSREAYELIVDAGGYTLSFQNWNAMTAIETYLSAFASHNYFTFLEGCQGLPLHLASKFQNKGGALYKEHHLVSIEKQQEGALKLTFETPKGKKSVVAKQVILAIPGEALKRLASNTPLFQDERVLRDFNAVNPIPAAKIYFGYNYPWWRSLQQDRGHSVTDLEIRECYYFGSENASEGSNPQNNNALLNASYHDGAVFDYWKPMWNEEPNSWPANSFVKKGESVPPALTAKLSKRLVHTVQRQLMALHGLTYIPEPYTGAYMDWGVYPFGGASYRWLNHVDVNTVMMRMRHPIKEIPLFVCGESYSDMQGWMEGALNNAELMLEEYFSLKRPTWIPKEYDLGPTLAR